jgi:predicted DCC family thiol-disulfide oxidoreductase YuxK
MTEQAPILLFDGVCNLCNTLVIFIIRRDKKAKILFSPIQSPAGLSLLQSKGYSSERINSIVFIEKTGFFLKSSAVLHIFKVIGGGWSILYGLIIIPKFILDFFYDLIAKNRYRIFGKSEKCMVPSAEIKERFLR